MYSIPIWRGGKSFNLPTPNIPINPQSEKKWIKPVIIAVFVGLVIIPVVIFFKRTALTPIDKPQTHSVVRFDSKKVQIVAKKDILEGKGIANSKIRLFFTPQGTKAEVQAGKDGKWTFQIPDNLKQKNYHLTVIAEDKLGNIAFIKSYPVKISQKTAQDNLLNALDFPPTAYAQSCNLQDQHPLYDCSNGEKCFNDYIVGASSCTLIESYPRSHCDQASECEGIGEGWTGTTCSPGGLCQNNRTNCGSRNDLRNQACEEYRSTNANEHCYTHYYRDSGTQCDWQPDYNNGTNTKCSSAIDQKCKALPAEVVRERELEPVGPEDLDKFRQLQFFGVYMAKDKNTGEIVYTSREDYEEQICNETHCVQEPSAQAFIEGIANGNLRYITLLAGNIRNDQIDGNCYIAADAMRPYFPDSAEFFDEDYVRQNNFGSLIELFFTSGGGRTCANPSNIKHDMDEETLNGYITRGAADYAREVLNQNDPFRGLILATDGIFSTGTILKLGALTQGYQITQGEEIANTGLALVGILPVAKIGSIPAKITRIGSKAITSRTALKVDRLSAEIEVIKRNIRAGERIPREVINDSTERFLYEIPLQRKPHPKLEEWFRIPDNLFPELSRFHFENYIAPAILARKAWSIPKQTRMIVKNSINDAVSKFIRETGRNIYLNPFFNEAMDAGRVFVIDDDYFIESLRRTGVTTGGDITLVPAYNAGDMILIKRSAYDSYDGSILSSVFHHEATHMRGSLADWWNLGQSYFPDTSKDTYKALTLTLELMTDYWADISRGVEPFGGLSNAKFFYASAQPFEAKVVFERMLNKNPALLDDLKEFALTGDGPKIIQAVTGKTGHESQIAYLKWFREDAGLNVNAITVRDIALFGAGGAAGAGVGIAIKQFIIEPMIEIQANILLNVKGDEQVDITGVEGCDQPGDTCRVSSVVTEGGVVSDDPDLVTTVALGSSQSQAGLIKTVHAQNEPTSINQVTSLPGGEACQGTCTVTLPENLTPGNYNLKVYLHSKDSDEILDSDSEPLVIKIAETPSPSPSEEPSPEESPEASPEASPDESTDQESTEQSENACDDIEYCDENAGSIIHKSGEYNPDDPQADQDGCVYSFDDTKQECSGAEGGGFDLGSLIDGFVNIYDNIDNSLGDALPDITNPGGNPATQQKQVFKVLVDNQSVDINNLDQEINIQLPGVKGEAGYISIPVEVYYIDEYGIEQVKYLTLGFNYNPPVDQCPNWQFLRNECIGCELARSIEEDIFCSGGTRISDDNVEDFTCSGPVWCPDTRSDYPTPAESESCTPLPSYTQCGGTAGLEDYGETDTIRITPCQMDDGRIDYSNKQNLGDLGECP